jgi:hypothetical protein
MQNPDALFLILDLLPSFEETGQEIFLDIFAQISGNCLRNQYICSNFGVILKLIKLIPIFQQNINLTG